MRSLSCRAWVALTLALAGCDAGSSSQGGTAGVGGSGSGGAPGATTSAAGTMTTGATLPSGSTSGSTASASTTGTAMTCKLDGLLGPCCSVDGNPGVCIDKVTCPNDGDHTPVAGYCGGPTSVECCVDSPNTNDNPPVPAGWVLLMQSEVTTAMTNWAVMILHDPTTYPMYATAMQTFTTPSGPLLVMAIVQWHPPDFQNMTVHRGVTLFKQSGG